MARPRSTSRRYDTPYRPRPVAIANALGRGLARIGLEVGLREASLVRRARRATGLHFLGEESFREPMRRLLESIEREARLHPLGRLMARTVIVRNLANRLRIEALRDLHPEIFERPVARPVFIVGLQRTATTLLHRLLALHPELRALCSWEAANPAPLLERETPAGVADPRIRIAEIAERGVRYMAPDFFAIHPIAARGEEEDSLIFDPGFFSTTSEALMNVPSFTRWLESIDHRAAYQEYRETIQLLLWQRPGRWLGKTPLHLEHLDELLETFPDARIVHTHRDPIETVASLCSMLAHARGFFSDHVDPHEVGKQWLRKARRMVDRGMAARGRLGESAFLDVRYEDLLADPLKQVHRVADFIGAPLSPDASSVMSGFLADNPQHHHGRHEYAISDFGLSEAEVVRSFAAYRARFGFGDG
jgi:hypothetical protein